MKRSYKVIVYIIIWYIFFAFFYYNSGSNVIHNNKSNSLLFLYPTIIVLLILLFDALITSIRKAKKQKLFNIVKPTSEKYKQLYELNKKYDFNNLGIIDRTISEKEYSHKSFDRAKAKKIILYQIENNENNIREFILNAYRNKKIYDDYLNDYNSISVETPDEIINSTGLSKEKYLKTENEIINKEKIKDSVYNITIEVTISYITPAGRYSYAKSEIVSYQELCDLYMQWRNGKKYNETSKRERKYMTDELRYDVLKRDNFTCQKCGATVKDGVKLQVDHIIPVYKGGQTTMSNLQTLCDRCNKGKGIKDN